MRIEKVTLFQVRQQLRAAFHASTHHASELNHIVVRLQTRDLVGWGESPVTNDPYYVDETVDTAWYILTRYLVPAVLGYDWTSIPEFVRAYSQVQGHTFARGGLEMAAWDLLGRASGLSLSSLLGGTGTVIASGVSLGIESDEGMLLENIARYVDQGYRRIKLKILPGHDVRTLESVRRRFPEVPLMVDANGAYSPAAIPHLVSFKPFNLMMIEQPFAADDFVGHARLQRASDIPICLDESIRSAAHAELALAMDCGRIINIKACRVGGLLEAVKIHDLCQSRKVPVWCGGMHEYGIGRAANIALASLAGFSLPGDISGSDKYFDEDIVEPPILAVNGLISVFTNAGIGVDVVEGRINDRCVRQVTAEA